MTANTRNGVRPAGRSPPFLAIGLVVALVILGFNYWSLSARNGEQANEIAVLESEMRLMNAKKISAEKRSEAISDKVKDLETELAQQKSVVADKIAQLANIGNELDRMKSEKQGCEVEFQKCEHEKVPICLKEKEDLKMELTNAKEALEQEKNLPKTQGTQCDESSCSKYVDAGRSKLLDNVANGLGMKPLYTLYKMGVDIGKYAEPVKQMAAQGGDSIQQGQAGAQQAAQGIQPIVNAGQGLAQPNQNQPMGNQQPNPAENQPSGNQQANQADNQSAGDQAPVGAKPPMPQNAQDAKVVEQELPQVPNPNDALGKADGQNINARKAEIDQMNPDALDRIQPNPDMKLDKLDSANKLQQASNNTKLSSEDKKDGATTPAGSSVNANSSATVTNTTKSDSENGAVDSTNTSMPIKEQETTKANTTTSKAQKSMASTTTTKAPQKPLDGRLRVDNPDADDAAGDGDEDDEEVALPDNDRDMRDGLHRDDTLRVKHLGNQDNGNNDLGDDYDYKDEDLDDDYKRDMRDDDLEDRDFDIMKKQLEKQVQQ